MPYCSGQKKDGGKCRRKVKVAGQRCRDHRGTWLSSLQKEPKRPRNSGSASPKARESKSGRTKSSRSGQRSVSGSPTQRSYALDAELAPTAPQRAGRQLSEGQVDRVKDAAGLCANIVVSGWTSAVAGRAVDVVGDDIWRQLCGSPDPKDCRVLAKIAEYLLDGQNWLHAQVGTIAEAMAAGAGLGRVPRQFARELGKRLPLPMDAHLLATARGVQVTGIVLCLSADLPLDDCRCFVDLAVAESKERVKALLEAATQDWAQLA